MSIKLVLLFKRSVNGVDVAVNLSHVRRHVGMD